MLDWWNALECKAKAVTAVLALLGIVASGAWCLDVRYAKADDLLAQQQTLQRNLTDLKLGQLQSDRRLLLKELFALEQAKQRGLTQIEQERQRMIEADLADLDREIARLQANGLIVPVLDSGKLYVYR